MVPPESTVSDPSPSSLDMRPWQWGATLLLAVVGVWLSIQLTIVHLNPMAEGLACNVNEYWNCSAVAQSQYSTLLGLPLSVYGLGFYGVIGLLSIILWTLKPSVGRLFRPLLWALASAASLGSLLLWGVSAFILQKFCLYCVMLYGVSFVLWAVAKGEASISSMVEGVQNTMGVMTSRPSVWMGTVGSVVLVFFLLQWANQTWIPTWLGSDTATTSSSSDGGYVDPMKEKQKALETLLTVAQQQIADPSSRFGNRLGAAEAKVIVYEFTDFQCPFCAVSVGMMLRLTQELPGVQVRHVDFPLNKACNPDLPGTAHEYACLAAQYGVAAKRQGAFWDLAIQMFAHQQELSEPKILEYATALGLDVEKLKADAHSARTAEDIKESVAFAKEIRVEATPSLFVNQTLHTGMPESFDALKREIQGESASAP